MKHSIKYREVHGLLTRQVRAWNKSHPTSNEPVLPVSDIVSKLKELNPGGVPRNKWHSEHKAELNASVKLWKELHPNATRDHRKATDSRRRGREVNALGSFTRLEWCALKGTYRGRCAYCGKKSEQLTVDHIIPLNKGGTNTISNIVPACGSCNSSKCDKLWDVQPSLKI